MQKPLIRSSTATDKDRLQDEGGADLVVPLPLPRARALSTGSIDNTVRDDPLAMDTSTDVLLFRGPASKPSLPPKPKRKVTTNSMLICMLWANYVPN